MADTVVARGLTKRFGAVEAVRGIDFQISFGLPLNRCAAGR